MKLNQVAEAIQVCEFDLFRQAYANAHECSPRDDIVARAFVDYAEYGVIPVWVSQYAKATMEHHRVAELDRAVA